jgi:hypothetical protein
VALCSDALATLVDTAGFAVIGQTVFSDWLPDPQTVPVVHTFGEDPNMSWLPFAGPSAANTAFVELRTRALPHDYQSGLNAALNLWLWACRLRQCDVTVTAGQVTWPVRILGVTSNYPPHLVRRDDQERPMFATDMMVTWTLPQELHP